MNVNGTGRLRVTFTNFVPEPYPVFVPAMFFYLTGNGNPALVLDGGDIEPNLNYPSVGAGIAYPQSTSPLTFSGDYGISLTQQNGTENDTTGEFTANAQLNTLSGNLDANSGFNPTLGNPLTGTLQPPAANGQFSGTLSSQILDFSPLAADYCVIDAGHGFLVETDLVNPNGPSGAVSLGYYALRIPVCNGCP